MKKMITAILILLIVGAIVGITGTVIYLSNGTGMKDAVEKTEKLLYNGEDLSVEVIFDKIELKVVDGNEVTFNYYESEKVKRTIKNENGKISFETEAPRFFNWIYNKYVVKIGIPKDFGGELEIETETGNVLVDLSAVTCQEIDIESTTGNVTVKNATIKEEFSVKVATGKVEIKDVTSEDFSIESTTGSVDVSDIKVSKNVKLKATTGNIKITNLSAKEVKIKLTTGSLKEGKIDCEGFTAEATTGSLTFSVKNATKIYLKATTGSIRGEIVGNENDYNIESTTSTGSNNLRNQMVPSSDKLLKAETSTGSITVNFIEE